MSSQNRPNSASSASSQSSGAPVRGGRGRGLHPTASVHAHSAAPAPLNVPAPRPQIAHQIIQQCQEFLVQLAWQEVRSGATTTVAEQKNKLLESFQRFIVLFLNNGIPAANASYALCPEVLRTADRTAAVERLNQSTGTGRASLTKDSLYRKAKKGVQKLLKYMADWVRICKDPSTRVGQFTPAVPPSGHDRDWVWNKIKSTEHRSNQCLKIWKMRSENRHLAENTDAAVREALTHLIFARRGMSLDEEMAFRGRHENSELNEEHQALYSQIQEEVDSGQVLVDSDDEDPPVVNTSRVSTSAPRGYFEQPYCEMSGIYHSFELAFKAFTQYAGSGHADIDAFYTSEWVDLQRTQASSGANGRNHQRNQNRADQMSSSQSQANSSQLQANSGIHQQPSQAAAVSSQSMHQLHDISAQMEQANLRGRHTCMMATFEKAIEVAGKLNEPVENVQQLQRSYLDYLKAEIDRQRLLFAAAVTVSSPPPSVTTAIERTTPTLIPLSSSPARTELPRATQRRRIHTTGTIAEATRLIQEQGEIIDNEGDGNCLFYCLAHIEYEYLSHSAIGRRPREKSTHEDMRARVVHTLRLDSEVVQIARVQDVQRGQLHSIYADTDMEQQKGSIDDYCNWMAQDATSGRSVTLALVVSVVKCFWRLIFFLVNLKSRLLSMSGNCCKLLFTGRSWRIMDVTKGRRTQVLRLQHLDKIP